jgi:dynactin-5
MYYAPVQHFNPADYIQTSTGNKISRQASIVNPNKLEIPSGKVILLPGSKIDCENEKIILNKYVFVSENSSLVPSSITSSTGETKYVPMTVGSHTFIGRNSKIEAGAIGSGCWIGDNVIIGQRAILKDYVHVESNTIIPSDTCIPPFCCVSSSFSLDGDNNSKSEFTAPSVGKIVDQLPPSVVTTVPAGAITRYKSFVPSGSS